MSKKISKKRSKDRQKNRLIKSKKNLAEKKLWTALLSIDGIGRSTFRKWLIISKKHELNPRDIWVGKSSIYSLFNINEKIQESIKNFKKEHTINSYWEMLKSKNVSVILENEKEYPSLLKHIDDRPILLYVKGDVFNSKNDNRDAIWERNPIAIVGTRRITSYGKMVTKKISQEIVEAGGTIISGFMYGVDVCAQRIALDSGGQTAGVLGFGFDHMYPMSQQRLYRSMLEQGAVFVTEFAPHVAPKAGQFPSRNRIIAGMSLGVIVTEAAKKSGSVITAECALEYGRNVFAVPGPITNLYSEGTKKLINQGAMLIGSGDEVVEELQDSWPGWEWEGKSEDVEAVSGTNNIVVKVGVKNNSEFSQKVIEVLQASGSLTSSEIATTISQTVPNVIITLTSLEIEGKVSRSGGEWVIQNLKSHKLHEV